MAKRNNGGKGKGSSSGSSRNKRATVAGLPTKQTMKANTARDEADRLRKQRIASDEAISGESWESDYDKWADSDFKREESEPVGLFTEDDPHGSLAMAIHTGQELDMSDPDYQQSVAEAAGLGSRVSVDDETDIGFTLRGAPNDSGVKGKSMGDILKTLSAEEAQATPRTKSFSIAQAQATQAGLRSAVTREGEVAEMPRTVEDLKIHPAQLAQMSDAEKRARLDAAQRTHRRTMNPVSADTASSSATPFSVSAVTRTASTTRGANKTALEVARAQSLLAQHNELVDVSGPDEPVRLLKRHQLQPGQTGVVVSGGERKGQTVGAFTGADIHAMLGGTPRLGQPSPDFDKGTILNSTGEVAGPVKGGRKGFRAEDVSTDSRLALNEKGELANPETNTGRIHFWTTEELSKLPEHEGKSQEALTAIRDEKNRDVQREYPLYTREKIRVTQNPDDPAEPYILDKGDISEEHLRNLIAGQVTKAETTGKKNAIGYVKEAKTGRKGTTLMVTPRTKMSGRNADVLEANRKEYVQEAISQAKPGNPLSMLASMAAVQSVQNMSREQFSHMMGYDIISDKLREHQQRETAVGDSSSYEDREFSRVPRTDISGIETATYTIPEGHGHGPAQRKWGRIYTRPTTRGIQQLRAAGAEDMARSLEAGMYVGQMNADETEVKWHGSEIPIWKKPEEIIGRGRTRITPPQPRPTPQPTPPAPRQSRVQDEEDARNAQAAANFAKRYDTPEKRRAREAIVSRGASIVPEMITSKKINGVWVQNPPSRDTSHLYSPEEMAAFEGLTEAWRERSRLISEPTYHGVYQTSPAVFESAQTVLRREDQERMAEKKRNGMTGNSAT